jgi:hypothetical protein
MWRAFFLGIGIFMLILGAQFLAVEKAVLRLRESPPATTSIFQDAQAAGANKVVVAQPWWAWSLMSTGAVTCLYSFTIPRRIAGQ